MLGGLLTEQGTVLSVLCATLYSDILKIRLPLKISFSKKGRGILNKNIKKDKYSCYVNRSKHCQCNFSVCISR